jgi:hypothetical protein
VCEVLGYYGAVGIERMYAITAFRSLGFMVVGGMFPDTIWVL